MSAEHIAQGLTALARLAEATAARSAELATIAARYVRTLRDGGTIFFAGNGGSAADAQHLATEYVVRYRQNRRAFPAVALTTDTSLLTAAGNDLGFDHIFARQVEALCRPGDLLVLHSTSGNSPNLIAAARTARARQVAVVGFLGRDGGALAAECDERFIVASGDTSHIQEV
ncbi:MAG: SIS domain-containing protein, partial [Gemmatimonadota bacterium]